MTSKLNSSKRTLSLNSRIKFVAFAGPLLFITACGFLSNPDRKETPSRLMLDAQAEYDAGNYTKAIELLEKLVEKDPSNEEGRIRLTFAYNGSLGITPTEFIKTFASSSGSGTSGGSDISKLTGKSSLPDATVQKLKTSSSSITSVEQLRTQFKEFATFQKAFLALCPLFSTSTMAALKTKAASALDILEVSKCGDGRPSANANVSIAALSLALGQFSSLYKAILDADNDGKFDLEEQATAAKSSIDSLDTTKPTALETLRSATNTLTYVGSQLQGEVFKLAISQFSIIDAVIAGTNLPTDIKAGISAGVSSLNSALDKINGYLDAGKSTGTTAQSGSTTAQAAANAQTKAETVLSGKTEAEIDAFCKDAYCFKLTFGTSITPSQCVNRTYTADKCTTTPTIPQQ
ncbi:MAG: hypothetical protein RI953_41 [Pseudomonadota bacterium]|jgi:hypothetical protein